MKTKSIKQYRADYKARVRPALGRGTPTPLAWTHNSRHEEAARWAEELDDELFDRFLEGGAVEPARWAYELDEEEDNGSDAYDPERGGGFI